MKHIFTEKIEVGECQVATARFHMRTRRDKNLEHHLVGINHVHSTYHSESTHPKFHESYFCTWKLAGLIDRKLIFIQVVLRPPHEQKPSFSLAHSLLATNLCIRNRTTRPRLCSPLRYPSSPLQDYKTASQAIRKIARENAVSTRNSFVPPPGRPWDKRVQIERKCNAIFHGPPEHARKQQIWQFGKRKGKYSHKSF